jgi:hypothetical protein
MPDINLTTSAIICSWTDLAELNILRLWGRFSEGKYFYGSGLTLVRRPVSCYNKGKLIAMPDSSGKEFDVNFGYRLPQ